MMKLLLKGLLAVTLLGSISLQALPIAITAVQGAEPDQLLLTVTDSKIPKPVACYGGAVSYPKFQASLLVIGDTNVPIHLFAGKGGVLTLEENQQLTVANFTTGKIETFSRADIMKLGHFWQFMLIIGQDGTITFVEAPPIES